MKIAKRVVTLLLTLTMLLVSAGCGGKDVQQTADNANAQQEQTRVDDKKTDSDIADVKEPADNQDVCNSAKTNSDGMGTDTGKTDVKDGDKEQAPSNDESEAKNKPEKPATKEIVTFSIKGDPSVVPNGGVILSATDMEVSDGDTVYSLLERICNYNGIALDATKDGTGAFINAIDGIACFDNGPMSGWIFAVNDELPSGDSADCRVKNGDVVVWYYACDVNNGIGG